MTQLVVALTGTDHHPFERLVEWIDAAADRRPDVHFLVQHGSSRAPRLAEGCRYLAHDRLVSLLCAASAVVCHAGPGLIMEARDVGHVPLCVPRDPELGEHVDGHQQRFAALAASNGEVRAVLSQQAFEDVLDGVLADPAATRAVELARETRARARALVAAELDELLASRPFRLARLHRV